MNHFTFRLVNDSKTLILITQDVYNWNMRDQERPMLISDSPTNNILKCHDLFVWCQNNAY